jgi:hypothetical protein
MTGRIFAAFFLAGCALFFASCANDQANDPNRVSTIPWNRPEQWEGQGPLGGFNQESR